MMGAIIFLKGIFMKRSVLFLSVFFLGLMNPASQSLWAQTTANADPVEYVVEDIQGSNVQVKEENSNVWDAAQEGQVLETGDEIRVGDNSEATLTLQSDTQVHLSADSDLKVGQIEANDNGGFLSHLVVVAGNILSDVKKNILAAHSSFEVEAGGVVCAVRGTAFEVSNINGQVETATHEGEVATGVGGETHLVEAGNVSTYRGGQFQGFRHLRPNEVSRFQKWRAFRNRIRQKRMNRIRAIRSGRRAAWTRRHGRSPQAQKRREQNRRRWNHG